MSKKLFVGNLATSVTDDALGQLFGAVGTVTSAQVMLDRASGTSEGSGTSRCGRTPKPWRPGGRWT